MLLAQQCACSYCEAERIEWADVLLNPDRRPTSADPLIDIVQPCVLQYAVLRIHDGHCDRPRAAHLHKIDKP